MLGLKLSKQVLEAAQTYTHPPRAQEGDRVCSWERSVTVSERDGNSDAALSTGWRKRIGPRGRAAGQTCPIEGRVLNCPTMGQALQDAA